MVILGAQPGRETPSLFIGLNGLAAFIWGMIGVCILLGYGAALLAHKFSR